MNRSDDGGSESSSDAVVQCPGCLRRYLRCTEAGRKPWSKRKKVLWRLGTVACAPVGVPLFAAATAIGIIVGTPVCAGVRIHGHYAAADRRGKVSRLRRSLLFAGGVTLAAVASPAIAAVVVGTVVPVVKVYVRLSHVICEHRPVN